MSVKRAVIIVTSTLIVATLMVHTPVSVTLDTLGMEEIAVSPNIGN